MQQSRTAGRARRAHGILWEGNSLLDDAPIVAIATTGSSNVKTGPMVQVWILRQDVAPHAAKRVGLDFSVCGPCALRDACYVVTEHAPRSVWTSYRAGHYRKVEPGDFARTAIRWGAYGDPALLPEALVRESNAAARAWTGYTHQHTKDWARWSEGVFMASVETPSQEARLRARGWGTFRVGRTDGADAGSATICPHPTTGITCLECKACDGGPRAIFVSAHGSKASLVPAERLRRKASR